MNRRRMLQGVALGSATVSTAAIGARSLFPSIEPECEYLAQRLRAVVPLPVRLLEIGRKAQREQGTENPAELARRLFPSATSRRQALEMPINHLKQHLRGRTRQDYQMGRLANVGGWLISETEAIFAALVAASEE